MKIKKSQNTNALYKSATYKTLLIFRKQNNTLTTIPIYKINDFLKYLGNHNDNIRNMEMTKSEQFFNSILKKYGEPIMIITSCNIENFNTKCFTRFIFDNYNQCLCTQKYETSLKMYRNFLSQEKLIS